MGLLESVVIVDAVNSGSPADAAGLMPGDQLLFLNENVVNSTDSVGAHRDSEEGSFKILRGSQEMLIRFTKPSADAALGITLRNGSDLTGIVAIADAMRISRSLTSIK